MALPPRKASLLCLLSNGPSGSIKPTNVVQVDELAGNNPPPDQPAFYAYNRYFQGYPDEVIVKSHANHAESVSLRIETVSSYDWQTEFPDDIVYSYRPQSPFFEPVPNPNGEEGSLTGPSSYGVNPLELYPRWYSETAIDMKEYPITYALYVPDVGSTIVFGGGSFNLDDVSVGYTLRASVNNLDSEVYNYETNDYEYYPFKQATTKVEWQRKFKVVRVSEQVCCWNEGTIIRGKVKFKSVNLITTPRPSPGSDYGWDGMEIEIGSTFSDAGEADWEVTIEEDYSGAEIAIPYVDQSITFINDYYVTEVIKPT